MIGVKIDKHRLMWLGGNAADPVQGRRMFIYDVRTQTFRETAPVPFAKTATDAAGQLQPLTATHSRVIGRPERGNGWRPG